MTYTNANQSWRKTLHTFLASTNTTAAQGIPLLMPEYRPDICRAIAWEFNAEFFDYRASVMQARGMLAHEITLDELNAALMERASVNDIVAFNVESLLATKDPEVRQAWIVEFCLREWKNRILLPLSIYHDDVPNADTSIKCIDFRQHLFTPQTLISRLAM